MRLISAILMIILEFIRQGIVVPISLENVFFDKNMEIVIYPQFGSERGNDTDAEVR
jgi:hypothetical protein